MKILFFNYEYPPLGGGAGNASFYFLREFAKNPDLEMDFITSSEDNEYHREEIGGKIIVHRLPIGKNKKNLHFQSQKDLLVYAWKAYLFSRKLAKENKYDLSHSFFTVPCGFLSYILEKEFKIPYIVSLRGSDVPGYSERFSLIYAALKPVVRLIWKNADAVISNSEGLRELAKKTGGKKEIEIIHNGIDTQNYFPNTATRREGEFIITPGASRVTARKGIKYIIEAVGKLSAQYPNITLKIMGDGDEKYNLQNLAKELKIEEKVEFLGRIPHKETPKYYQEASVFVLPSFNEGMSNAMLEALATGLPIISTNTGGAKELVKDGINGFIVEKENEEDIAKKIIILIENPDFREKMGRESRKIAETMSWKKVAGKYLEVYNKIIR